MIKVVTVQQMRDIEAATDAAGVSYDEMMLHAGKAVAEIVMQALGNDSSDQRVVVLVGPGNNGGDGLVAARILKETTAAEIGCYLLAHRSGDDPVYRGAVDAGVFIAVMEDDQRSRVLRNLVESADVVVDALLGTGARLPVEGDLQKLLKTVSGSLERVSKRSSDKDSPVWPAMPLPRSGSRPAVIAVDCPSGLDCDTGELDPAAIPADITVTFAAAKTGQMLFPGAEAVGELVVAPIGTPRDLAELDAVSLDLVTGDDVAPLLPRRLRDSHKGTFGRALIAAGSINYTGAVSLAGEAAYRVGAGLVTLSVPQPIYPILASQLREVTWLLLPHDMGVINRDAIDVIAEEIDRIDALCIGPGLGSEEPTAEFIRGIFQGERQAKKGNIGFVSPDRSGGGQRLEITCPLVIDADGLNLLAGIDQWWTLLPANTILTPHPGEMARLTGLERDAVQADRAAIAREKAAEWNCVVVLKGAFTVIAEPGGQVVMMPFAIDALATAGTGDVLAGCITGFAAQGLNPFDAAVAGAYVHGLAGQIAASEMASASVLASDVLAAVPLALEILTPA